MQDHIIDLIEKSKKSLTIVQPYYYPVKKIEKAIERALDRGVKVNYCLI